MLYARRDSRSFVPFSSFARRGRRYHRAMKNSPSARSDLLFCLLTIVPFFLAAEAKVYDGMTGLSLGIYSALVFCRCNYFLISPMFLAGTALSDAGLQNILYCAAPILLFGVAKAIHFAAARPMGMFAANVYAMIGQLPSFLFVSDAFPLRLAVASVAANQLLCYCATVIGYALIVRGVRNRLSADEVVGGAVVAIVLSLGLFRADVFGFSPYFALLGWLILASLHSFSTPAGLLIAFCMGMGGAVASLDFAVCGAAVAMFVVACAFRKLPCIFRFAAIMVADFLAGTLLGAYPYTLTHIISLAAGGVCFVALPKKVRSRLAVYIPEDRAASAKRILAHGRGEVFARLTGVAKVFFEMGKSFAVPDDRSETSLPAPQQIAQDVMLRVCARCPSRESCQRALGSDTSALFVSAASTALSGGGAAPADLPPFVISRCDRTDVLVNECNNAAARLVKRRENAEKLGLARRVIAEQMYGVGSIVSAVADDVNDGVTVGGDEDELIEKLGYRNIVCTEAVTYQHEGCVHASLTVRRADCEKKLLDKTVDEVFGHRMQRDGAPRPAGGDRVSVSFRSRPRYGAVFGAATARKQGSDDNGDSRSVRRLNGDKLFVAVCDGMGSGAVAARQSASTLSMVENFYNAGFGGEAALNMINRMLMLKDSDDFSALDLCVFDLNTAVAHFVKLGGVQSFVKRADSVDVVETSALPIGIVEEARPYTESRMLSPTDSVVMVSDGVADALGADGIKLILSRTDTLAPQDLCDALLAKATEHGAKDDSTVVAVRLFAA